MRELDLKEAAQLTKLSRLREQLAQAELSEAAQLKRACEERLQSLRGRSFDASSATVAGVVEKWLVWRDQDIKVQQVELARASAHYLETAKRCGRFIAQAKVVEELAQQSVQSRAVETAKHQSDEILRLHLLAHDVSDQNI